MKLRICTWNTWHGLNPYQRILMLPMEGILARRQRRVKQLAAIRSMHQSEWDLFCFQEICPIGARRQLIERELNQTGLIMKSSACASNVGVKLAGVGLPPFLSEGLVTLSGSGFRKRKATALTLSGSAREMKFAGVALSFQLKERRRALVVEANAGSSRIAVVNLHLHHGPSTVSENALRKKNELKRLAKWLKPRMKDWDLLSICGDFNCDPEAPELAPLRDLELQDLGLLSGEIRPTWAPMENPWAELSSSMAGKLKDEVTREWDGGSHRFDRIYFKSTTKPKKITCARVFDAELSDHFGVLGEITLK